MFFTREDIEKIHQGLLRLGIKDSELPETTNVNSDDTLAVVQDGKNKKINIEEFFNNISLFKKEGFINITDRFNKHSISLIEAIQTVPTHQRIDGLVITFEDINGDWRIYQFRGNAVDFFDENKWTDLYDYTNYIVKSITPDEEDLTVSKPDKNGNAIVSLKDRVYDESNFSGKGYKILRKNIQTINEERKNVLTQDMINVSNTVYEIRYDFDINDTEITIPEGCVLKFSGGSLSNGTITLNDCIIEGNNSCLINVVLLGKGSNDYVNSNWFRFNNDISFDAQQYIQSIFNLAANKASTIDFNNEKFYLKDNSSLNNSDYAKSYSGGIYVYGNTTVNLYNTEFHSLPNLEINNGNLLFTFYQDNITINGGLFFGNADTVEKYDDKHHGISIIGGKHIYINNTIVKNFNGDGIFISRLDFGPYPHKEECDDVLLQNIKSHYNSRMGITVICGTNIVINNCDIQYTGYYFPEKSNPGAAIDIEPNQVENTEKIPVKVKIIYCFCKNNKIGISTGSMANEDKELIRHVEIYNNIIYGTCFFETRNLYVYNNNFYNGVIYFRSLNSVIDNNNFNVEKLIISKKNIFLEDDICNITISNSNIFTTTYNYTENTNKNINININNCILNNGYKNFNNQYAIINIKNCIFNYNLYLYLDNVNIYNSTIKSLGLSVNVANIYNSNIEFNIPEHTHTYINSIDNKMNLICYNTLIKANESQNNLYSLIKDDTYSINAKFVDCIIIGKIINNDINKNALNIQSKKIRDIYYEDNNNIYKYKMIVKENKLSFYNEENKLLNYKGLDINIKDTGTFAEKPLASTGIPNGFAYFCTNKQTAEGQANGIMIYHKGNNVWVDALGRVIS